MDMKTDSTTLLAQQHRRTLTMILVSALLALALASALAVFTGILSHPTATGARSSATGFALQDLPGTQSRVAGGRLVRVWAGVCATVEAKYRFDRT